MDISSAKLQESRVEAKKKLQGSGGMFRPRTVMAQERKVLANPNPNARLPGSSRESSNSGNQLKEVTFTRLSPVEEQRRRENGLYFKCDEKFHRRHICKNKHV